MILLDSPSKSLELALALAVTANPLPFFCEYATTSKSGDVVSLAAINGSLVSATVVACPAPVGTVQIQQIKSLSTYNADTVAATVTVQVNNNGTRYTRYKVTLQPGDNLFYMIERGFYVVDSSGNVRGIVPLPLGAARDSSLTTLHTDLAAILALDGATTDASVFDDVAATNSAKLRGILVTLLDILAVLLTNQKYANLEMQQLNLIARQLGAIPLENTEVPNPLIR